MVSLDNQLKLSDFGWSVQINQNQNQNQIHNQTQTQKTPHQKKQKQKKINYMWYIRLFTSRND